MCPICPGTSRYCFSVQYGGDVTTRCTDASGILWYNAILRRMGYGQAVRRTPSPLPSPPLKAGERVSAGRVRVDRSRSFSRQDPELFKCCLAHFLHPPWNRPGSDPSLSDSQAGRFTPSEPHSQYAMRVEFLCYYEADVPIRHAVHTDVSSRPISERCEVSPADHPRRTRQITVTNLRA